ncbi:MAG: hypothetical protein ABIF11_00810 [Nitrospirota bacterium]
MLKRISILFLGLTMLGMVNGKVGVANAQTYNAEIIGNSDKVIAENLFRSGQFTVDIT